MFGFEPAAELTSLYEKTNYDPWLIPGLIPKDSVVVLASLPKVGKTAFATALARALATGGEFLGHQLKPRPVLWCAHEETPPQRLKLHEGLTAEDPLFVAYADTLPALDDPNGELRRDRFGRYPNRTTPYVFEEAVNRDAGLIVIDSLHAAVKSGDLASNSFARHTMEKLTNWAYHLHCAVLVLHHLTKSATRGYHPERFADSTQILASANTHFFMERNSTNRETDTKRFTLHGAGRYPEPIRTLEIESPSLLEYRLASKISQPKLTQRDRILQFFEDNPEATAADASAAIDLPLANTYAQISRLVKSGDLAYVDNQSKSRTIVRLSDA